MTPTQILDAAEHRAGTAPAYRQYTRTANDPFYDPDAEDALMLLRGLFLTSYLVDDFLAFAQVMAKYDTAVPWSGDVHIRSKLATVAVDFPEQVDA